MADAPKTLVLNFPVSSADQETLERIERITKPPESITDPVSRALLYLRGASGRASIALPAFYMFMAAEMSTEEERKTWSYSDRVKHYALRFSAITTVALCIRAIYDHVAKDDLCAKVIMGASDVTFSKVAAYWTKRNNRDGEDARAALEVVQDVLKRCAIPINVAKKSKCILARRIAFLKAYADRESAHISVNDYEYTFLDVAHVVAATALMGAVIHHFDHPGASGHQFLTKLDEAAHAAALAALPDTKKMRRLFEKSDPEQMIHRVLKGKLASGTDYLSTYLPSALRLDAPPPEFFSAMAAKKLPRG